MSRAIIIVAMAAVVILPSFAHADSTAFVSPTSVDTSRTYSFTNGRPQLTFVDGDTAWTKIVVTALNDGDVVTGAIYFTGGWMRDISDSLYYSADTVQFWIDTDSAGVLLLYQDVSD